MTRFQKRMLKEYFYPKRDEIPQTLKSIETQNAIIKDLLYNLCSGRDVYLKISAGGTCFTVLREGEEETDPTQPLERKPNETTGEFIDRVVGKMGENKLTINAARESFGLPPINNENENGGTENGN